MASAEELRAKIAANQEALRQAIEAAGTKWEQSPGGDEWAPRKIAEHAIGSVSGYAGAVATAMQGRPPERPTLELKSNADALKALEAATADMTRVVKYVEDHDLTKSQAGGPTIESSLNETAGHLAEHAQQIQAAIK
jgi:hypothetical protein